MSVIVLFAVFFLLYAGGYWLAITHACRKEVFDPSGNLYLTRWHLLKLPFCRVFLHRIWRKDHDRDPHNHPWPWGLSLILWGAYEELRTEHGRWVLQQVRWLNWIGSHVYHRILDVKPNTWTLFITGPRTREWGFHTEQGHVDWRTYLGLPEDYQIND